MSNFVKPRHPECGDCRFFSSTSVNRRCKPCGVGEFFEEKIVDRPPTDNELMKMFAAMSREFGDDD